MLKTEELIQIAKKLGIKVDNSDNGCHYLKDENGEKKVIVVDNVVNSLKGGFMNINAIFVKSTNEILFSRHQNDFRESEDRTCAIDGGFGSLNITGNNGDYIIIRLNGDVLLQQILNYDYLFQNKDAKDFPEGYHGRYKITEKSNVEFFKNLVINFYDIEEFFKK